MKGPAGSRGDVVGLYDGLGRRGGGRSSFALVQIKYVPVRNGNKKGGQWARLTSFPTAGRRHAWHSMLSMLGHAGGKWSRQIFASLKPGFQRPEVQETRRSFFWPGELSEFLPNISYARCGYGEIFHLPGVKHYDF